MNLIAWATDSRDLCEFINILLPRRTVAKENNVDASLAASGDHDEQIPFVALGERLAIAASREGLPIHGP